MDIDERPAPAPTRRRRTRLIVGLSAAGVVLVAGGVTAGLLLTGGSNSPAASTDPDGVKACQMMLADKKTGLTPDTDRSNQEIMLLTDSKTLALRNAARQLGSSSDSVQMGSVGNLFTGCAQVGVPLN